MSKIAICSDIHFHSNRGATKQIAEDEIFDVFNQIVNYCVKNNIDYLYVLGDLFHIRGKITVSIFNRVYDLFREITSKGIKIGLLSGNHDQVFSEDEKTTSIYSLQEITGVTLINWKNFQHGKCNFVGIPYVNTKKEFSDSLEKMKPYLKEDMINVLFTHGVVSGAMIGSGYSFSKSTGVDSGLGMYSRMCVGHIHIPQLLFDNRVVITGSPLTHTKKDLAFPQLKDSSTNNKRGFWIMNTETGGIELIPTEHTRFLKYNIGSKQELESILSNWNSRDFLFLTVNAEDVNNEDHLVKQFTNEKIDWDFVKPPKTNEIRLSVEIGTSEEKIIEKFIDLKCEGFDKELLMRMSADLLEEYDLMEKK
jgi:DNA repair exonuclease SbcCD nuclease subunit